MIIWINGAFGAGKTTLAQQLHRELPDALPFDPEYVGHLLLLSVPEVPGGDFQNLPLWRKLTAECAAGLAAEYGRPLIVPMTLVEPSYQEEIFGPIQRAGQRLLHVFLDLPAEVVRSRIDAQELMDNGQPQSDEARAFRHANVARCVAARSQLPPGTLILRGDQHTPAELAGQVLKELDQTPG